MYFKGVLIVPDHGQVTSLGLDVTSALRGTMDPLHMRIPACIFWHQVLTRFANAQLSFGIQIFFSTFFSRRFLNGFFLPPNFTGNSLAVICCSDSKVLG